MVHTFILFVTTLEIMQSIQDNIQGAEGYNSNNNWIREQWIANLKKKQRNECFETSMDVFTPSYGSGEGPFAKYSPQASDQERVRIFNKHKAHALLIFF